MADELNALEVAIRVKTSELNEGLNQATEKVTTAAKKMQQETNSALQSSAKSMQSTTKEAAATTVRAVQETENAYTRLAKAQLEAAGTAKVVKDMLRDMASGELKATPRVMNDYAVAMQEARRASLDLNYAQRQVIPTLEDTRQQVSMAGAAIGVQMPEQISRMIARMRGVPEVLNAAFAGIAIVAVIELIVKAGKQVYEFIESLHKLTEEEKKGLNEIAQQAKVGIETSQRVLEIERQRILVGKTAAEQANLKAKWAAEDATWNEKQLALVRSQYEAALKTQQLYESGATKKEVRNVYSPGLGTSVPQTVDVPAVTNAQMKQAEATILRLEEIWGKGLANLQRDSTIATASVALANAQAADAASKAAEKASDKTAKTYTKVFGAGGIIDKARKQMNDSMTEDAAKQADALTKLFELEQKQALDANNEKLRAFHERTMAAVSAAEGEADAARQAQAVRDAATESDFRNHKISAERRQKLLKDSLDAAYEQEKAALLRKLELLKADPTINPETYQRALNDIAKLDAKYKLDTLKSTQQFVTRGQKMFDSLANTMSSAAQTALNGWMQGTQSLGQAWARAWNGMVATVVMSVAKIVAQYALAELLHKQSAARQVMTDAKVAAAHAYKWAMASVPFPANLVVAPLAAAGAFTAVMAFAAFKQGGMVPYDMPAYLHAKEMVLPEDIATPLRASLAGGGGVGGGITITMPVQAIDSRSFEGMIEQYSATIAKIVKKKLKGVRL